MTEQLEGLRGELQRARDEKQDLLSKIEAKEGINTALQQLKVENVRKIFLLRCATDFCYGLWY